MARTAFTSSQGNRATTARRWSGRVGRARGTGKVSDVWADQRVRSSFGPRVAAGRGRVDVGPTLVRDRSTRRVGRRIGEGRSVDRPRLLRQQSVGVRAAPRIRLGVAVTCSNAWTPLARVVDVRESTAPARRPPSD